MSITPRDAPSPGGPQDAYGVTGHVSVPKDIAQQYPDLYASSLEGDCMEPQFQRGDKIILSPSAKPEAGDFGVFWPKKEGEQPQLKRLVMPPLRWDVPAGGECMPIVIIEQTNPPRRYAVAVDRIRAAHKVIARMSIASEPGWRDDGTYLYDWGNGSRPSMLVFKVRTKKGGVRAYPIGNGIRFERDEDAERVRRITWERLAGEARP